MSLETAIEKLADAILAHANAMVGVAIHDKAREVAETVAATKRGPGRPRKTEPTEQPPAATASPAAPEAPAATDAGGPAADPAPVAAPSPAAPAQPQAGSPMAAAEVPKEAVQRALIKFVQDAEKRKPGYGRHTATAMCEKYGSKNVTGIAPGNYAALLADIEAAQAKVDSGEFAA